MIVIPMAGVSRRFTEAGYGVPKYQLMAHGQSVFAHAVGSFEAYFATQRFLFIVRDVAGTVDFVRAEAARLGIARAEVVVLAGATAGQAETVALGLAGVAAGETVTIFNIDTFRPGFRFPESFDMGAIDGYLEVFEGEGANWSYVRPVAGSDRVAETAEKVAISNLCCTGLYHFGSCGLFLDAFGRFAGGGARRAGLSELYVAPMYNDLIAAGRDVRFFKVAAGEVIFCGVPAEYEAFLARGV